MSIIYKLHKLQNQHLQQASYNFQPNIKNKYNTNKMKRLLTILTAIILILAISLQSEAKEKSLIYTIDIKKRSITPRGFISITDYQRPSN